MIERIKSEHTDKLCKAIASIKTVDEAYRFLDDLCTLSEIEEMSKRLNSAEMLSEGVTYNEIAALTGSDGYHMVLERIQR